MSVATTSADSELDEGISRVCFLDLDDTLIPTTWLRTTYEKRLVHTPPCLTSPNGIDLALYESVKKELDDAVSLLLGRPVTMDEIVIEFLELLKMRYDTVVVVTNARSHSWIRTFKRTFRRLWQRMEDLDIQIVKTEPTTPEPLWTTDAHNYFLYWSNAKLYEFNEILKPVSFKKLELTCVGDNNFEHFAFIQLCESLKPSFAHIIKCTCGLSPKQFVKQLTNMTHCIRTHPQKRLLGGTAHHTTSNKHVKSITWSYSQAAQSAEKPLAGRFKELIKKALNLI